MNHKSYISPALQVVEIKKSNIVCASQVYTVGGNAGLNYGGGGVVVGRAPGNHRIWD